MSGRRKDDGIGISMIVPAVLLMVGVAVMWYGFIVIGAIIALVIGIVHAIKEHIDEKRVFEELDRRWEEEQKQIREQERLAAAAYIADTGSNTGRDYERFCASVLKDCDYYDIELTATSGDFGADIVATDEHGVRWAVQCKYYNSGTVGIAAVQEVVSSLAHYKADRACVMTTARLTERAKQLARENRVMICEEFGRGIDFSLIMDELTYE